jgi:restriction system protein
VPRRRTSRAPGLLTLPIAAAVGFACLLALSALTGLVEYVSDHSVTAILGLIVLAVIGVGAALLYRRREARLAAAYEQERQAQWAIAVRQSQEIARYHAMSPREFEQALGFLCARRLRRCRGHRQGRGLRRRRGRLHP